MDLRDFLDKLRNKDPEEELRQKRAAQQFEQNVGSPAPAEEGITELGSETKDEENERVTRGVARSEVPFGLGGGMGGKAAGKVAELAERGAPAAAGSRKFTLQQLEGRLAPERVKAIGEEIRLTGKSHLFDDKGNLLGTVGDMSKAGQEAKTVARESLEKSNSMAPTVVYKDQGASSMYNVPKVGDASAAKAARGPKGEALEYMNRTGVDPRSKTGLKVIEELRKKKGGK